MDIQYLAQSSVEMQNQLKIAKEQVQDEREIEQLLARNVKL
jgi:hypothetical protein